MTTLEAKASLDKIIAKSRIHLYKPIQIAEILYRDRVHKDIDISDLESYRNPSKSFSIISDWMEIQDSKYYHREGFDSLVRKGTKRKTLFGNRKKTPIHPA